MKRTVYIALCAVLGFLLSTLLHAAIELPLLHYIVEVRESSPDEFVWGYWSVIHSFAGSLLWIVGLVSGYVLGRRWWHAIYEDKRQLPWISKNSVMHHLSK